MAAEDRDARRKDSGAEYVHLGLDWETIVRQVRDEAYARVVP
jgi:hypothetical protein